MFTFPTETTLHKLLADFCQAEKVTAVLCHRTCALLYVNLSNGKGLIEGKTMAGFANVEEDFANNYVEKKVMPFRIRTRLRNWEIISSRVVI